MQLQKLYKLLSAKYPNLLFGYKALPHEMFYTMSVFDRKRGTAKYNKMVEIGLSDQEYINTWKELVNQLYGKSQ